MVAVDVWLSESDHSDDKQDLEKKRVIDCVTVSKWLQALLPITQKLDVLPITGHILWYLIVNEGVQVRNHR